LAAWYSPSNHFVAGIVLAMTPTRQTYTALVKQFVERARQAKTPLERAQLLARATTWRRLADGRLDSDVPQRRLKNSSVRPRSKMQIGGRAADGDCES